MWKFNWMLIGIGFVLTLGVVINPPTSREISNYGDNSAIALIPLFLGIGLEILRISFVLVSRASDDKFGWRDIAVLSLVSPALVAVVGSIVYDHSWIRWDGLIVLAYVGLYGELLFVAMLVLRSFKSTAMYWRYFR